MSLSERQANASRWLGVASVLNGCTWTVVATATTPMGLGLAPSRTHLLAMMSTVSSASALVQFLLLPMLGWVSDAIGRRPILLLRAASSVIFPSLLALRPTYFFFIVYRFMVVVTWYLSETSQNAALADVYEGTELAVATARVRSSMGIAMLFGPVLGGWLAERSLRACFVLSSCFGALNFFVYGFCVWETLGAREAAGQCVGATESAQTQGGGWARANPFRFLELFRKGRSLAWLALASCCSEMCDGTYVLSPRRSSRHQRW
jgi:MFS family permease